MATVRTEFIVVENKRPSSSNVADVASEITRNFAAQQNKKLPRNKRTNADADDSTDMRKVAKRFD